MTFVTFFNTIRLINVWKRINHNYSSYINSFSRLVKYSHWNEIAALRMLRIFLITAAIFAALSEGCTGM